MSIFLHSHSIVLAWLTNYLKGSKLLCRITAAHIELGLMLFNVQYRTSKLRLWVVFRLLQSLSVYFGSRNMMIPNGFYILMAFTENHINRIGWKWTIYRRYITLNLVNLKLTSLPEIINQGPVLLHCSSSSPCILAVRLILTVKYPRESMLNIHVCTIYVNTLNSQSVGV